jgi:hypothetical protein
MRILFGYATGTQLGVGGVDERHQHPQIQAAGT